MDDKFERCWLSAEEILAELHDVSRWLVGLDCPDLRVVLGRLLASEAKLKLDMADAGEVLARVSDGPCNIGMFDGVSAHHFVLRLAEVVLGAAVAAYHNVLDTAADIESVGVNGWISSIATKPNLLNAQELTEKQLNTFVTALTFVCDGGAFPSHVQLHQLRSHLEREKMKAMEADISPAIPAEFRTKPMSKAEAGTRQGLQPKTGTKQSRREAAGKAIGRQMKDDQTGVRFIRSGNLFIFDNRQVPDE